MSYWELFDKYKETRISSRLIKHSDVKQLVNELDGRVEKKLLGYSAEGREIFELSVGAGPHNILIWSQMHGNEATATGAIFDVLNHVVDSWESSQTKAILNHFKLVFIPMLNPDGALKWTRVNAMGIDLNRDAVKQQAPETKLLWKVLNRLNPLLCFNLHDQRNIFNVSGSSKTATISFLSASFDVGRNLNKNRLFQMDLIGKLNLELQKHIPGHIGRYTDEFYPTATGDNLQIKGFNNILIESGTYKGDPERQVARRGNYVSIMKSLELILEAKIIENADVYNQIPQNSSQLYDVLIKNVEIKLGDSSSLVDLGIMLNEKPNQDYTQMLANAKIENIGDLSHYYGIAQYDAQNSTFSSLGNNYPELGQKATFSVGEMQFENGMLISE